LERFLDVLNSSEFEAKFSLENFHEQLCLFARCYHQSNYLILLCGQHRSGLNVSVVSSRLFAFTVKVFIAYFLESETADQSNVMLRSRCIRCAGDTAVEY